ncbi:putative protein containing caspase domain protein [Salinivirga cyanobacteriivorans]|uniref:Peptidase C14 caspase domain-containing protein n=1 Tax=Salinivirga cyanobacteriivorans TaxID=1307839 RepID=A0A0S2I0J4_9BACT|nr:caspase family protein [Salinivirga cyanobacteriivorans]ALO15880.1 putative protein containing caspase domain protein [Salinivirga cyanobacteriivorans]
MRITSNILLLLILSSHLIFGQTITGEWTRNDNSVYKFSDDKALLVNVGFHLTKGNFQRGEVKIKNITYNGGLVTGLSKIKDKKGNLLKWKKVTIRQFGDKIEIIDPEGKKTILTKRIIGNTDSPFNIYGRWRRVNEGSIYDFEGNIAILSRIGWMLEQGAFMPNQVKIMNISYLSDNLFSGETRINDKNGKLLKWEPVNIIINGNELRVQYSNTGKSILFVKQNDNEPTDKIKDVPERRKQNKLTSSKNQQKPQSIDTNIPSTTKKRPNTYALIIGNEDYTKFQSTLSAEANVDFAANDATIFHKYCIKTLGIPAENLKLRIDGISSQMKRDIKWLTSRAKYGGSDVQLIFYYAGHGFPDPDTKKKYIMPVDITGAQVREGIALSSLYKELTTYPAEKVTVFLDACFSGGGREQGLLTARGVKIKPRNEEVHKGKLIVFSGSSGDQESLPYKEKRHGIFTYYLLKKIQQTKGAVTYKDLSEYLMKKVPLKAIDLFYKEQLPEVNVSYPLKDIWKGMEL